jgi:hypothetical protein
MKRDWLNFEMEAMLSVKFVLFGWPSGCKGLSELVSLYRDTVNLDGVAKV